MIFLIDKIFKSLNIKIKPEKILTYIFYGLSIAVAFYSITKMLSFWVGNIRIDNNISPYLYAILIIFFVTYFT